jgi:poly(hydroxyalkanoate) depolymerase family esterase
MELIDWRELYAANRAVIEGRAPMGPGGFAPRTAGVAPGAGGRRVAAPLPGAGARPAMRPPRALAGPSASPRALPARRAPAGDRLLPLEHDDGRRARPVYVYVPPGLDPAVPAPLVVMLHGCTQTAASFSSGSLMNRTADRHGFVVAYPEQSREDNAGCCWNWFSTSHQARGGGEPAWIAGATRTVADTTRRWTIDPARVFVAGMSAGGAMAAVMAATYPDVFAAVAIHSGLAYGSARTLPAATQAMSRGGPDPEAQGAAAFAAMGAAARVMPALVLHGTADGLVAPVNAEHAVRQWMATNRRAAGRGYDPRFDRPDAVVRDDGARGLPFTRRTWHDVDGRPVQELIEVDGLGHAWSGGAPGGSYTDPRGPSAATAIHDFFARVSA